MRLEELEKYIMDKLGDLIEKCIDVCKESTPPSLQISDDVVYEGCDMCLLSTALDELGLDTFSVTFRDGRFGEFVRLSDGVIEVTENSLQFFRPDYFPEYLKDLEEFGLIDGEAVEEVKRWINSKKSN